MEEKYYSIRDQIALQLFDRSEIAPNYLNALIRDACIPYLINIYYRSPQRKTIAFDYFLRDYATEHIKKAPFFPILLCHTQTLSQHIKQIRKNFPEHDSPILILGDMHPEGVKCRLGDIVVHRDVLHLEHLVNHLIPILDTDFPYLLSCTLKNGYWSRTWQSEGSTSSLEEYYYDFGKVSALIMFLKGMDYNFENYLIATNGRPLLFDTEFLFNHQSFIETYTISYTGLMGRDPGKGHVSALFAGITPIISLLVPVMSFKENNEFFPQITWEVPSKRTRVVPGNREGIKQNADTLISGFSDGFNQLLGKKNRILECVEECATKYNVATRILARPTKIYRAIQMSLNYLRDDDPSEYIKNKLRSYTLVNHDQYNLERMITSELEVLKNYTIPYFYSFLTSKKVYAAGGIVVGEYSETPLEHYKKHVAVYEQSKERYLSDIRALLDQV